MNPPPIHATRYDILGDFPKIIISILQKWKWTRKQKQLTQVANWDLIATSGIQIQPRFAQDSHNCQLPVTRPLSSTKASFIIREKDDTNSEIIMRFQLFG